MSIKIDEMAKSIKKELNNFSKVENEELKKAVKKAGKESVKKLKKTSPKKTGRYAKSWTQKIESNKSTSIGITVHAKRYQVTHLLEHGHEGVAHGQRIGRVKAYPHIEKVEKEAEEMLMKELSKKL